MIKLCLLNIVDYSSMLPYGSKSLLLQLLSKNYPLLISPKDYMLLVKVGQIGGSGSVAKFSKKSILV